jgi:hypothetical protein
MKLVSTMVFALLGVGFAYPPKGQPSSTLEPASFVAPEDKALVVFVRPAPRYKTKRVNFHVFDESKKLLTAFKGKEHVTIEVAPGKHTFYVVSEDAGLVRAEVAAGRTYVVLTQPKIGILRGARVVVRPVLRNSSDFAESAKWIRETKRGEPDFAKGNKWVKKHEDRINMEIKAAEVDWLKMDEKARGSMTMRPEDGRTADEAGKL